MRCLYQRGAGTRPSALQVGKDGEHPAVVRVGLGEAELAEDALDVLLDGAVGDEEGAGDRAVRAALGHEGEDLALARGEGGEPAVAPAAGEELADDLGVQHRPARGDVADRGEELGDVSHAVLEQVAGTTRAGLEQLGAVALLDVLREDEHGEAGDAGASLDGRLEALVTVARGHPDVHHRHVRAVLLGGPDQARTVAHGGDHLEAGVGEQPREALPEESRVLGDHYPHRGSRAVSPCIRHGLRGASSPPSPRGISARTRVGPPGGLCTRSWPSSAASRSASPESPPFATGAAAPAPSSVTSTTSRSSGPASRHTVTPAAEAAECLAALERASIATKYAVVSTASGRRSSSLTSTETGTGDLSQMAERAASRPLSVRMAGWMPLTRSRISARARLASACASSTSSRAASGSSASFSFAIPRPIARETRRC